MTWLGKILTFLVFLLALVWAWFSVSVYVTRTNWKSQAEMYKKAFEEAKAARSEEYNRYAAERDADKRTIATEQEKSRSLADQVVAAETARTKAVEGLAQANAIIKNGDVNAAILAANIQAALDELNKVRARSEVLENNVKDLTIAKSNADRERQAAENLAKQTQAEKLIADKKIDDLVARVGELEATGGSGRSLLLQSLGGKTAPVPAGLRGTVTGYQDGLVVLSVGIDAGLTIGATLDIYREDGGGQYLGTVVIDRVYPKQAVAVFKPKDERRNLKQLRPDELPKVGDLVGRINTSITRTP